MTHTPTPWTIDGSKGTDLFGNKTLTLGIKGEERFLALLGDNAEANAEFIVRACNAHDELLEAAKAAIEYIFEAKSLQDPKVGLAMQALKQAIAKAEGK